MLPPPVCSASASTGRVFRGSIQSSSSRCVRFKTTVTDDPATLATGRALPPSRTGLPPAGSRQLRLAPAHGSAPQLGGVQVLRQPWSFRFGLPDHADPASPPCRRPHDKPRHLRASLLAFNHALRRRCRSRRFSTISFSMPSRLHPGILALSLRRQTFLGRVVLRWPPASDRFFVYVTARMRLATELEGERAELVRAVRLLGR